MSLQSTRRFIQSNLALVQSLVFTDPGINIRPAAPLRSAVGILDCLRAIGHLTVTAEPLRSVPAHALRVSLGRILTLLCRKPTCLYYCREFHLRCKLKLLFTGLSKWVSPHPFRYQVLQSILWVHVEKCRSVDATFITVLMLLLSFFQIHISNYMVALQYPNCSSGTTFLQCSRCTSGSVDSCFSLIRD